MIKLFSKRYGFAYQGRFSAGFDPTHVCAPGTQLSAVFSNGTFINYFAGLAPAKGTISGTVARKSDAVIGPCKDTGTSYAVAFTIPIGAGGPSTMAAIIRPGVGNDCGIFHQAGTGQNGPMLANFSGRLWFSTEPTNYDSGITLADSTPYFVAASFQQFIAINFVAVNLNTGKLTTATIAAPNPNPTNGTAFTIGHEFLFSNFFIGQIACVMASANYYDMQRLIAWAGDPWSFWYPRLASVVAFAPTFVSTPPLAPSPPIISSFIVQP